LQDQEQQHGQGETIMLLVEAQMLEVLALGLGSGVLGFADRTQVGRSRWVGDLEGVGVDYGEQRGTLDQDVALVEVPYAVACVFHA
jgi:hypothetical protein